MDAGSPWAGRHSTQPTPSGASRSSAAAQRRLKSASSQALPSPESPVFFSLALSLPVHVARDFQPNGKS